MLLQYEKNQTQQYTAVALEIKTGRTEIEKGEGTAQIGELRAALLAVKFGAQIIYTDSYAVFKGATEWIGYWKANGWQVNWVPVWRTEDWRQLSEVGQGRTLQVGWVKAHNKNLTEATHWNNKVDYLTHIHTLEMDENTDAQEWARLRK